MTELLAAPPLIVHTKAPVCPTDAASTTAWATTSYRRRALYDLRGGQPYVGARPRSRTTCSTTSCTARAGRPRTRGRDIEKYLEAEAKSKERGDMTLDDARRSRSTLPNSLYCLCTECTTGYAHYLQLGTCSYEPLRATIPLLGQYLRHPTNSPRLHKNRTWERNDITIGATTQHLVTYSRFIDALSADSHCTPWRSCALLRCVLRPCRACKSHLVRRYARNCRLQQPRPNIARALEPPVALAEIAHVLAP